jgi:hypothetical protein
MRAGLGYVVEIVHGWPTPPYSPGRAYHLPWKVAASDRVVQACPVSCLEALAQTSWQREMQGFSAVPSALLRHQQIPTAVIVSRSLMRRY